ncbi:MAG: hypothetical protein WDW38_006623 [Sanguina aurantia]
MTWTRLQADNVEFVHACVMHAFGGRGGSNPTPVAVSSIILEIILALPGKKATAFRKSSAVSFLNVLNPSPEFLEQVCSRLQRQQRLSDCASQDPSSDPEVRDIMDVAPLVVMYDKVIRKAARAYGFETRMYVRMRLPGDYLQLDIPNQKQFTMRVLKFGITYSLQDRDQTYAMDNGYMAYDFQLRTRLEAEAIEHIIKADFADLVILNSKEYLDAPGLRLPEDAEFLGLLVALRHFIDAQRDGTSVDKASVQLAEPYLHIGLIGDYFDELEEAGMIQRGEVGGWLLCRSLDNTSLLRIYEFSRYRLPLQPVERATALGIDLPPPLLDLLAKLADTVATTLAAGLDTVYPPDAPRATLTKELVS